MLQIDKEKDLWVKKINSVEIRECDKMIPGLAGNPPVMPQYWKEFSIIINSNLVLKTFKDNKQNAIDYLNSLNLGITL